MRTYTFITIVFLLLFCLPPALGQQNNPDVNGTWSGTVSYSETAKGITGTSERHVAVTIVQNNATGSHRYTSEGELGGIHGKTDCQGFGDGELHIITIRNWDSTYDIHIISPSCTGTSTSTTGSLPYGPEQTDIIISDKKYSNPNTLSGTETTISELPGDLGKVTRTITWNLTNKPNEVELIVTPEGYDKTGVKKAYDDWLPEPGNNELTKGSVMTISLKLQGKDGKPLKIKAKSFELRLSNTSKEPGITINYPVGPRDNQLPDLRFIPANIAESDKEDQFISIPCADGSTGKGYIGSYDGGGWTTLTVEAILQDSTHIKGKLLVSGGEENILIPKRITPESKIAISWLLANRSANGIPAEMDDKETSNGNAFKGDGLTAYEEYRGVISESKFKRLDPNKKEVGIEATQSDFSLFANGLSWFKNASDLEPVRFDFDRNEIASDGQLNMNSKSAHNFDQHAIYLFDGGLGSDGTLGVTYSRSKLFIPAQIIGVIIDWDYIQKSYRAQVKASKPETLIFTLQEYLAQTVAHELGHAVNMLHHGSDNPKNIPINSADRIIYRNGNLMIPHPDTLRNIGDSDGTVEGGSLSCMLNYYPYFSWAQAIGDKGVNIFRQEPLLPLGKIFCKSRDGTGINATKFYFGNAEKGDCLGQIQLRN